MVLSFSVLVLAGCGQEPEPERAATAVPVPATSQAVTEPGPPATLAPVADPDGTSEAATATSPLPSPKPAATVEPVQPAATVEPVQPAATTQATPASPPPSESVFELFSPVDGIVSEVGSIRVLGRAEPGAWAIVNETPVAAGADGFFQFDLILDEGPNTIEVAAANAGGRTQTRTVEVSFVPSNFALPFTLFYPLDGMETKQPSIPVLGATRPDAVVAINGNPVESGASGIFGGTSSLEEGANLVEVVATDIDGNVRSAVIAVFYIP